MSIPVSEDGRTPNVSSLNYDDLVSQGKLKPISMADDFSNGIYVVVKGDMLWRIAENYNTTWKKLVELNDIENPDLIYPGIKLNIPMQ